MSRLSMDIMGLGPPVCTECYVVGELSKKVIGYEWQCPVCHHLNLKGSLFTFTTEFQELIGKRSRLISKDHSTIPSMNTEYIARRKFMSGSGPEYEPNEYYRPWLEKHIGKQGADWNWNICFNDLDILEIYFRDKENATLFELTWPQ